MLDFLRKKAEPEAKPEPPELGPWFLPRDWPEPGNVSFGIWKERRLAAEFAVGIHAIDGYRPGWPELAAIAAHVVGRDHKPQNCAGRCAATYRLALNEFFDGCSRLNGVENPDLEAFSEKIANAAEAVYGEEVLPGASLLLAMKSFWLAAEALKPWDIKWKSAQLLAVSCNAMESARHDALKGDIPLPLIRLYARQALLESGILLRWEQWAFSRKGLDRIRDLKYPLDGSDFRDMLEMAG